MVRRTVGALMYHHMNHKTDKEITVYSVLLTTDLLLRIFILMTNLICD